VTVSPDNRWLLVNDLGLDRILVYRFDETTAELTANAPPFYEAIPGSGPRNVAFHPNSRWVYSLNEVSNTVDVLDWDAAKGILTRQQNISTLPPGFTGTNTAGTVAIDSAGRYVYISNRGANDIVVFPVEATNGRLGQALQRISCGGKTPRHIALDPSGRWLLVANQDSGTIDVFARDPESGRLTAGGTQVRVDQPVCIVFV
jgi:6-phosphogluconolactonase